MPRDDIALDDVFDWHGDHPHTNFRGFFIALNDAGYYVELLHNDFTQFAAERYAALLIVDGEDEFDSIEMAKLHDDVQHNGLSLIIIGDWNNAAQIGNVRHFDTN